MGCRLKGHVIAPFDRKLATDGTYSDPDSRLGRAVWVAWTDGTKGWTYASFLQAA